MFSGRSLALPAAVILFGGSARADGVDLGLRLSRATLGAGDARFTGYGNDDYYGRRDVDVLGRDHGVTRPTFTVLDVALGGSVRYAAIYATFGGGPGGDTDVGSTTLRSSSLMLTRLGIEPRVQLPIDRFVLALGATAGWRWISTPLIGLHAMPGCRAGCGGRASASQVYFAPRITASFAVYEDATSGVTFYASSFVAVDALHIDGRLPLEFGLGVSASGGLSSPSHARKPRPD